MATIEYLDVALFSECPRVGDESPSHEVEGTRQEVMFVDGVQRDYVEFLIPEDVYKGVVYAVLLRAGRVIAVR